MNKDIIYILIIITLILIGVILFKKTNITPSITDTTKYDKLRKKYDSLYVVKFEESLFYRHKIDSLESLPEKIKYINGKTKIIIADGSVAILDSIIRSESGIGFK